MKINILGFFASFSLLLLMFHCGNIEGVFKEKTNIGNSDNQSTLYKKFANIMVTEFSTPATGFPGENINVTFKIKNNTDTSIDSQFPVTLIIRSNNDYWLKSWVIANLAKFTEKSISDVITIPSNFSIGNYSLLLAVDIADYIKENNESDNNSAIYGFSLSSRLVAIDFLASITNLDKANNQLSISIANIGNGTLNFEYFGYKVYLSQNNNTLEANDTLLYSGSNLTNTVYANLPSGSSTIKLLNLAGIGQINSGNYYLILSVDPENQISESDESNNIASILLN